MLRPALQNYFAFYRRLTSTDIPVDVGDFRLVDRKAVDAVKGMREHSRFLRGMFAWIGFRQSGVQFHRAQRYAGETKYPLSKMLRLAVDGILSFSNIPLRLALIAGILVAGSSFAFGLVVVILKLVGLHVVSGWTSLVVIVTFLGGVQLMVMGIMGEYLARMYDEVRGRPLYILDKTCGFGQNGDES